MFVADAIAVGGNAQGRHAFHKTRCQAPQTTVTKGRIRLQHTDALEVHTELGQKYLQQGKSEIALEKLNKMEVMVGYPDKWRDYSALTVRRDDAFGNAMRNESTLASALFNKALILHDDKRDAEALPLVERSRRLRAPLLGEAVAPITYVGLSIMAVVGWIATFAAFANIRRRIVHYL